MANLAKGNGPAVIQGFGLIAPAEKIVITVQAAPSTMTNADLLSLVPLEGPDRSRITVHMPWDNGISWQYSSSYMRGGEVFIPLESAWLGQMATWRFTADVAGNLLTISRNNVLLASKSPEIPLVPFFPFAADMHIGGRPSSPFQGQIGAWSIDDGKGSIWPWVIGIGVAVGLVAVAKKGKVELRII